jgi:hypothetical protein
MTDRAAPISLAASQLGDTRHVCAFFGSDDEDYRVLLQRNPFFVPPERFVLELRERRASQAVCRRQAV